MSEQFVDVPQIAQLLRVSRRTAWRYVERDDFPEPVVEATRKRLWRRTDVVRWASTNIPFPTDPRKLPTPEP